VGSTPSLVVPRVIHSERIGALRFLGRSD